MGVFGAFKPNGRGMAEFMSSEEMRAHVEGIAEKIADAARATSPVGPLTDPERDRYRDGWRVETDIKQGEPRPFDPNRRARATVVNDTPYAAAIEFGNGRTKPEKRQRKTIDAHYTLTRAIDLARE